jgi:hypothetical protein
VSWCDNSRLVGALSPVPWEPQPKRATIKQKFAVTLEISFSHPSLVIYLFATPPIKFKLGQQIRGGLLTANHLEQLLWRATQKHWAAVRSHLLHSLWQVHVVAAPFTSHPELSNFAELKPFSWTKLFFIQLYCARSHVEHPSRCSKLKEKAKNQILFWACENCEYVFFSNIGPNQEGLYIWSGHYARKVAGWRLFDHQKHSVMPSCLSVMPGFFFFLTFFTFCYFLLLFLLLVTFINYFLLLKVHCLLLFVIYFTACNFHKLRFTIERGQGNWFIIFMHCLGGGGVPIHMIRALRSRCLRLEALWPPKIHSGAEAF